MLRVVVDVERCCGYGECASAAPNLLYLGNDSVAHVIEDAPFESEDASRARTACPVDAVRVEDILP